jgi:hypothetical protein
VRGDKSGKSSKLERALMESLLEELKELAAVAEEDIREAEAEEAEQLLRSL